MLDTVRSISTPEGIELALRLAAALGGSAESWLRMQAAYDLWQAGKGRRLNVKRLRLVETVKSLQLP